MPRNDKETAPFWSWTAASADTEDRAVLVLSGAIDSGESWYDDAVWPERFRSELDAHAGEDIQVEINSPGGDVFAGFEIYNMLLAHTGSVRVRVVGMAASAASLIAMAADPGELVMCEASMLMIHNPWTSAWGNSEALREQADVLDMIRDVMCSCYMRRFAGNQEELERLLDEETWMTPARAVELGLCDAIEHAREDAEDGGALAMAGRYAAMSRERMEDIRKRFGVADQEKPEDKPMSAEDAAALLEAVDAMIASAFTL